MIAPNHDMDMCNGPLFGKILRFSLPIMAMSTLQLLFNIVGMIVVGQFSGRDAFAAVGATSSLINLLVNFFMGLSVGTSVVVAHDYGADKPDSVSRAVHTSIAVSILAGLFVMVLGIILCKPLLELMGTPGDIIGLSVLYMRIYFIGMPALMIYNFSAAILRAVGDSKRPMYYLIIAGLINVGLTLFFVVVMRLNVDGVAWAATISQYIAVLLIMICLGNSDGGIRFMPREMRIDRQKLKQIVKIGLPAGLQNILFSFSNVLIQSAINSFGSAMVAGSAASANIEGIAGTSLSAYYNAAITFTSQNMGAKKHKRVDLIARDCTILVFITWFVLSGLTMLFGRPLIAIFTPDPKIIEMGLIRLNILMIAFFTCGIMNVFPGLIRGMGYSILPMLCTLVGACLMRIVWLYTFFDWYPTVTMLFLCYPITWTLAGLGQVGSYFYVRHKVRRKDEMEAGLG